MEASERFRHPENPQTKLHSALAPSEASRHFWHGLGEAWTALTYVIGGILVWGGLGFVGDRVFGTDPILTVVGSLIGNAGGIYLVYVRFPIGGDRRAP